MGKIRNWYFFTSRFKHRVPEHSLEVVGSSQQKSMAVDLLIFHYEGDVTEHRVVYVAIKIIRDG